MRKRNWSQYNQQLVQRGSVHFLVDSDMIQNASNQSPKGKIGRPLQFSDQLILMLMMIKVHYGLTYRMLEGFDRSFHQFAQACVEIPIYFFNLQKSC